MEIFTHVFTNKLFMCTEIMGNKKILTIECFTLALTVNCEECEGHTEGWGWQVKGEVGHREARHSSNGLLYL